MSLIDLCYYQYVRFIVSILYIMSELHVSETLQFNSSCNCKNGTNGNSLHD